MRAERCNIMSNKDVRGARRRWAAPPARGGLRKYTNHAERERALAAVTVLEEDQQLFALVLAWTGARLSEVLASEGARGDPARREHAASRA